MKKAAPRKERLRKKPSHGISVRRFALTYILLMGAFFSVIGFVPLQRIFDVNGWYTNAVVWATSQVLKTASIPAACEGSIIRLPSIALDVRFGCNGLEAVMIYAIAIIAFPSSWRKKLIGIASGFLVLQVINVLRIAGLAFAGVHFPALFEILHIYVAQGIMIAVALGIFFVYLSYIKSNEESAV
jgi:exosortase/archaeosortase family protein